MSVQIDRAKLAAAMARNRVNVKLLAEKAGISRGTVTGIRCGRDCTIETARKLAASLGLPVADLLED